MQQAPGFGRRGVSTAPAFPVVRSTAASPAPQAAPEVEESWTYWAPLLTVGLVLLLLAVFGVELAASHGEGGLGYRTMVALGGVNGALVVGQGEWWRIFTAPLLHGGWTHIVGNCLVLVLIGWRLEQLIGRQWFGAVFCVSGVGGSVASFLLNPNGPVSVGASGAIMGLLAAAFVCSFHLAAFETKGKLRAIALRTLIPALIPTSGHVDYSAHLGGALAGAGMGVLLHMMWPEMKDRPHHPRAADAIAGAVAALTLLSFGMVALHFPEHAAHDDTLIPDAELPKTDEEMAAHAVLLEARYPRDPRSHYFRAVASLKLNDFSTAEAELRTGLAQKEALSPELAPTVAPAMTALLAVTLRAEERMDDAKAVARPLCTASSPDAFVSRAAKALRSLQLCD